MSAQTNKNMKVQSSREGIELDVDFSLRTIPLIEGLQKISHPIRVIFNADLSIVPCKGVMA